MLRADERRAQFDAAVAASLPEEAGEEVGEEEDDHWQDSIPPTPA